MLFQAQRPRSTLYNWSRSVSGDDVVYVLCSSVCTVVLRTVLEYRKVTVCATGMVPQRLRLDAPTYDARSGAVQSHGDLKILF